VTTPSTPSEPRIIWNTSGPAEMRGTSTLFSTVPVGVTMRTATSRSSMLP
jgi:hypothetical protein